MSRPRRLVLVCGTGTDVGKTWVACELARHWRTEGRTVRARKPAQSFDAGTPTDATDAGQLAAATGDLVHRVCPAHRWYEVALAPPMAASVLGRDPIALADLVAELDWPDGTDIGLLETAGGVRSPLAGDGDAVALGHTIAPDVVLLVAHGRLGAINDTLLSVDALSALGVPVVVHVNRFGAEPADVDERNVDWLRGADLTVETDPVATAERLLAPPDGAAVA